MNEMYKEERKMRNMFDFMKKTVKGMEVFSGIALAIIAATTLRFAMFAPELFEGVISRI